MFGWGCTVENDGITGGSFIFSNTSLKSIDDSSDDENFLSGLILLPFPQSSGSVESRSDLFSAVDSFALADL